MFARHGFQNVLEKAKLGRFVLQKLSPTAELDKYSAAERLRISFEELGPTFIKFGQVLASRPDLIPPEFVNEFKQLQINAAPLSFAEVETVLQRELGEKYKVDFKNIEQTPLASASIAQVHRAKLADGTAVVLKVQRPGIAEIIEEDLIVLHNLAEILEKYIPELKVFRPTMIVEELFKTLQLETNFVLEAHNVIKFQQNFASDPSIKIPNVYQNFSTEKVLVLEEIQGIPLSHLESIQQAGITNQELVIIGLRCFMKMVFKDGFFHGDLHAGNLIVMPGPKIALIDFGVVGRISPKVQDSIISIFMALGQSDFERLAYEFIDIAPYSDAVDADQFARELRSLLAPYIGLSMKSVNVGKLLMDATSLAAKHHVQIPAELILFFKGIITVEGMAKQVLDDFDLLPYALAYVDDIIKMRYDPTRVMKDLAYVGRDALSLFYSLPRQIKNYMRSVTSPGYSQKIHITELDGLKRSIESSSNIVFLGFLIGSLIVAGAQMAHLPSDMQVVGLPIPSAACFASAILFSLVAFYNYIRK